MSVKINLDDYRVDSQTLKIINANRKSMGLPLLGKECLKSTEQL